MSWLLEGGGGDVFEVIWGLGWYAIELKDGIVIEDDMKENMT